MCRQRPGSRFLLGKGDRSQAAPIPSYQTTLSTNTEANMAIAINFDARDSETGSLVKHHSTKQREHYLLRHPELIGKLPPIADPNARPAWELPTHVGGRPPEFARQAALMRDPVRKVTPTKPAKPEPESSLYRTAVHEGAGHAFIGFLCKIPVAQVSVVPDDKGNLGETRHADLLDTPESIAFLLAGEMAEIVLCGQARTAGLGGDRAKAREMAERIVRKHGGDVDELLEKAKQRVLNMMHGEERAMRRMAFELVRRKTIVFEEIEQVLDQALDLANREAVEKQNAKKVKRSYDFSKREDVIAFNTQLGRDPNSDPIGYTAGFILNGKHK
jgi:hypothetical protein